MENQNSEVTILCALSHTRDIVNVEWQQGTTFSEKWPMLKSKKYSFFVRNKTFHSPTENAEVRGKSCCDLERLKRIKYILSILAIVVGIIEVVIGIMLSFNEPPEVPEYPPGEL